MNAKELYKELGISLGDLNGIATKFDVNFGSWNAKVEDDIAEKIRAEFKANGLQAALDASRAAKADKTEKSDKAPKAKSTTKTAKPKKTTTKAKPKPLGYEAEELKSLTETLKIEINLDDLDTLADEDKARLEACRGAIELANELGTSFDILHRVGAKIGIEIGRVGFKGLSGPETFLLKAGYRTQFGGANPTLIKKAEEVEKPTFAEPTGNKAKEAEEAKPERDARPRERGPRGGQRNDKQDGPSFPPVDRGRGGQGGQPAGQAGRRTGRKRFEVKDNSYASQRRPNQRDQESGGGPQAKRIEMPTGPVTVDLPITLRQLSEALG
ncbi:MAG: hypothetical protein KDB07_13000, partial [Planctomycetes bacterium]|nr:hypothetical protein [Planctomycetota bacterium]